MHERGWTRLRTSVSRGFSLTEVLIAMVIVGMLTAVGLPAYQNYTRDARRAAATAALNDAASRQEQFFLNDKTYTVTLGTGGLNMSTSTAGGYYTLSVDTPTAGCPIARCYGLRATPQGGQMTPPTQWVTLISRSSFPTGGESGPTREDDIKGSIIVALLIVCLCHGRFASSSSRSVRPAGQRRHPVARGWGFSRSGTSTGSPISIITTPSLALCGTGPQPRRGRGAQAQGGVYGEAADGPRSSCSPPRQAERTDPQCVGCARFEGVPGSFGWRFSRWRIGGLNWTTSSTA